MDLSGTKGYFNIQVGSLSTNTSKRTSNDPHNSMAKIFQNSSAIAGISCSYTPAAGHARHFRITVDVPGKIHDVLDTLPIGAVPSAWVAETIQGIGPSQLVQYNAGAASALVDLSSVTKGLLIPRMTAAQKNAILSPATGLQVYDTTSNQINYFNGGAWVALGAAGGGGITTINTGAGLTGGPITTSGTIGLDIELAGLNGLSTTGFMKRTGAGVYSTASSVSLTADVSGVLPLANGGSNANLTAVNGGAVYSTGSALAITAAGTSGQVLTSSGAGAPTWAAANDSTKVIKAGDTMTGLLVLSGDPSANLGAATKQYVDTGLLGKQASLGFTPVNKAGDTMTGALALPSNGLIAGTDQLVLTGGNVGIGTTDPSLSPASGLTWPAKLNVTSSAIETTSVAQRISMTGNISSSVPSGYAGLRIDANINNTNSNAGSPSGSIVGLATSVGRNNNTAGDNGYQSGVYGIESFYGHFNYDSSTPNTTYVTGLYLYPYTQTGTVTYQRDIWIRSGVTGGTVMNHWAIYQEKSTANNYFAGKVGIGTTAPGAALEINSTTSGLLIPRMTAAQRDAIITPAKGLQVYNTDANQLNFYNGSSWQALGVAGAGISSLTAGTGLTGGTITTSGTIGLGTELAGLNGLSTTGFVKRTAAGTYSTPAISLTADISGVLPLANGGSNANLTASNGGIVYSNASQMQILSGTATAGLPLISGASTTPAWSTVSLASGNVTLPAAGNISNASGAMTVSASTNLTLQANTGSTTTLGNPNTTSATVINGGGVGGGITLVPGSLGLAINGWSSAGFVKNNASGVLSGGNSILSSDISDAASANTANKLVLRDGSGNFAAGTITANLTGTVTGASSLNVLKAGDTMTGALALPSNGLTVGTSQLAVVGGKVGIGTTSPVTKLDVIGNQYISGNVGIGTTAPSERLEVNDGFLKISGWTSGAWDTRLILDTHYNVANIIDFHRQGNPKGGLGLDTDDTIFFYDGNGIQRTKIYPSSGGAYFAGNVGIGTTAPGAALEVAGQVKITGGTPGVGKVLTSDASGLASWSGGTVNMTSTTYSITTSDSGKAFYYTNNANGVVNLPALSGVSDGFSVTIKRDVAKTLTVTPAGSDKFPGGVTTIEMQGQNIQSMTVMKLGSTWTVVNKTDECIVGQDCWTANSASGMKQLYVGSYNGHQYFTTPGGCGYEPSGSSTTTPPTANFTPTCSGTDTVQKAWATTAPESNTLLNLTNATDGQTQSSTLATYATANAAKYCENLDYAGYTDWYLPARQELALLYQNSGTLGGFLYSSYYWSSTEYNGVNAWHFLFNAGYLGSLNKVNA